MKQEYDFSKGARGKFYKRGLKLNLPVCLDEEVFSFVQRLARKRKTDLSSVVNQLLRSDIELAKAVK